MDVVSYKCPSCSAPLSFDIASQAWDCKFCESRFTLDELKENGSGKEAHESGPDTVEDADYGEAAKAYECPSCGGRIITDENTAATFCPYCHNPAVISSRLKGERRPQFIVPFKVGREEAAAALKKLCRFRPLLPKKFSSSVRRGEFGGLYVPFWLISCKLDASLTGEGRKVTTWRDSRNIYTKTDTYAIYRRAGASVDRLPADAATRIDNDLMEWVEPFDYGGMTGFSMEYLSGHFAEGFDETAEISSERARVRARDEMKRIMQSIASEGYDSISVKTLDIALEDTGCDYAMLPVWMLSHDYKGKTYTFAMNGQTGKIAGKLPISWLRAGVMFASAWAVSFAIMMLGRILL